MFPDFGKYWGESASIPEDQRPRWTNAYAKRWPTAWHAAEEFFRDRESLTRRTAAFERAMFDSTLPPEVIESATATASILRTPTCLQYEDGTFWGWEGCSTTRGCCEGSCTHVWNYAQTVAFLFPLLHRSMRRSEYEHGFEASDEGQRGKIAFRIPLPLDQPARSQHAAADGQLSGIVQLYRDWRLSGDEEYLRSMLPGAKKAIQYAFDHWDTDGDGLVDGSQHNTYDINFPGPNPLIQGFYLAALKGASEIAAHLNDRDAAERYHRLFEQGREKSAAMFNGEYFEQLLDRLPPMTLKYQHGRGCLSDQMLGQLLAHIVNLGDVFDREQVRAALGSIVRYNFRRPLGDHVNPQRIYALADESALLLCSWPRGERPDYPFPYSDEAWTGIEYQVAAHLVIEGYFDEAMQIVRAVRQRHDGRRRNPYNEFECGSHYARALSAWGLVLAISGFRYDAVAQTVYVDPRGPGAQHMTCFFSCGSAWGTFRWQGGRLRIDLAEGILHIQRVITPQGQIDVPDDRCILHPGVPWHA